MTPVLGHLGPAAPDPCVGDHLDRLIHVIEDHQLAVQPEDQVRGEPVVLWRAGALFALVVVDRVITRVPDAAAGTGGYLGGVVVLAGREELLQSGWGLPRL